MKEVMTSASLFFFHSVIPGPGEYNTQHDMKERTETGAAGEKRAWKYRPYNL